MATVLWGVDGQVRVVSDYFRGAEPEISLGWSHFEVGGNAGEAKYEFIWPLGDIVNALVRHDLVVERLDEYRTDADWRFGAAIDEARKLPGQMLLIARQTAK